MGLTIPSPMTSAAARARATTRCPWPRARCIRSCPRPPKMAMCSPAGRSGAPSSAPRDDHRQRRHHGQRPVAHRGRVDRAAAEHPGDVDVGRVSVAIGTDQQQQEISADVSEESQVRLRAQVEEWIRALLAQGAPLELDAEHAAMLLRRFLPARTAST